MDSLLQDLRYGARQLWRSPAFTVAAIATLTLGIGANTALFSLASAVLDRPAAGVQQSDDLIWVTAIHTNSGRPTNMSYPDLVAVRAGLRGIASVGGTIDSDFSVTAGDEAERVRGEVVSANYFTVLRSSFALGRGFLPAEDSVGRPEAVVVVSHEFWQRRLDGDSSAIGRSIVVNGAPMTIVGVTAEFFNGADLDLPRSLWMPIAAYAAARPELPGVGRRAVRWIKGIARLETGATPDRAAAAARLVFGRLAQQDTAEYKGLSAGVFSARSGVPAGGGKKILPVMILSIVVTGLVLLIACANVSNLLLARAVARRREISVRLSLGASRLRLMRQLLTESFLLALVAGAAGILLAFGITDWIVQSGVFPLNLDMTPDAAVVGFTTAAAAGAAILFGIVPALESTRGDLADVARDGARGRDPRSARLQSGFVIAQVAFSLVLLTTAGLFLRSMHKALQLDIGFQASAQVLALSFDLGLQEYSDDRASAFLQQLDDRARALPGVAAVSFADAIPLGNRYITASARAVGGEGTVGDSAGRRVFRSITRPGFFSAAGVPILHGRDFTDRDGPSAPRVAIVSDGFARESWPAENPIGQRITLTGEKEPLTVVGIATDIMLAGPADDTRPVVYVAHRQHPETKELTMLVRTAGTGSAGTLANALRRAIRELDPALPVFNMHTMAEHKRLRLADRRNGAAILGAFGALALLLASIGVYGVMSFSVAQRVKEIGIRVALGAKRADVSRMFIARGMRLTGIAIVIGAMLSLGLTRLIGGMLFGLTPTDAGTFAGVAGLLAGVALVACWFPARRAAAVDPALALRTD